MVVLCQSLCSSGYHRSSYHNMLAGQSDRLLIESRLWPNRPHLMEEAAPFKKCWPHWSRRYLKIIASEKVSISSLSDPLQELLASMLSESDIVDSVLTLCASTTTFLACLLCKQTNNYKAQVKLSIISEVLQSSRLNTWDTILWVSVPSLSTLRNLDGCKHATELWSWDSEQAFALPSRSSPWPLLSKWISSIVAELVRFAALNGRLGRPRDIQRIGLENASRKGYLRVWSVEK